MGVASRGIGHTHSPPPATGLGALGLSDISINTFAAVLQGGVAAGVVVELPFPSPAAPTGTVMTLSLLHLP